jgi:TonB family protein
MMSKAKLQILFLLLTIAVLAQPSLSQTIPCELKVKIFDGDKNISNEDIAVKFMEFENKKELKPNKLPDTLSFNSLNSGIYQVELNQTGYKKKIKKFLVDCGLVDETNSVFENIQLWKGDSKEVIKLDSTEIDKSLGVLEGSDSSNTTREVSVAKSRSIIGSSDNKIINGKIVNGQAINLVRPVYPPAAKAVRATGTVNVQITIDEDGNVIRAKALDGHVLLQGAAVKAIKQSKFSPTLLEEYPVKVTGVVVFNFGK